MNQIILNYLTQAILGGASGYITNEYAVNMLFKEYTPLKIGGVIKKTRTEFINNLSSLIENDIVNKDKLNKILQDENFKSKFEDLTKDFFSISLYKSAGSYNFCDVNGFNESADNTGKLLHDKLEEHIDELVSFLESNIDIKDFFTEKQIGEITDSIFDTSLDMLKSTRTIDKILADIYINNRDITPKSILPKEHDIIKNITCSIINILQEEIISDADIADSLEKSINFSSLDEIFNSSKEIFINKNLSDIITLDADFKEKLLKLLFDLINSEKGRTTIYETCESLFMYAKKCDKSIIDILNSSFEKNLNSYLEENIPALTESLISWIKENSENIDKIIEDSIDELIDESDSIKGKLLGTIKNSYYGNLKKKYNIIEKITDYIEKIADSQHLSTTISNKIIDLLNNLSVSEIVKEAENNNFNSEVAADLITSYLNNNLETAANNILDNLSALKIKDILPIDAIKTHLKNNLIDYIRSILASRPLGNFFKKKSVEYLYRLSDKELQEIANEKDLLNLSIKIKNLLFYQLNLNSKNIKTSIKDTIANIDVELKTSDRKNIGSVLLNEFDNNYRNFIGKVKDEKLSDAINKLNTIDNIYKNSSDAFRNYTISNIDSILDGSVKGIVTENLNRLNDDELVSFANDFIGRELKPIMYFGGILGVGAGILLAAFHQTPLNPGSINLINMLTYAAVGLSTNVIAINMIFRPYRQIKLIRNIPIIKHFSVGYIVKNQKLFAEKTSYFIENTLLNKDSINLIFNTYEADIKSNAALQISTDDYSAINKLISDNKKNIIKYFCDLTNSSIYKNKTEICTLLYNKAGSIQVQDILNKKSVTKLDKDLYNILISKQDKMLHNISSYLSSGKLTESKEFREYLNKKTDSFMNIYDELSLILKNKNNLKTTLLSYDEKYQNKINKPVSEIVSPDIFESLMASFTKKVSKSLNSETSRQKIINGFTAYLNNYFQKDKTFGNVFNGALKKYINKKLPDMLDKLTLLIKNNIKENKGFVTIKVQSEIKNNLGFLEKGMYSIIGGDELIDLLLYKTMIIKIPQFLDDKRDEINGIVLNILDTKFYNMDILTIINEFNGKKFEEIIDSYLSDTKNTDKLVIKLNEILKEIYSQTSDIELSYILKILSLNSIESIYRSYGDLINAMSENISIKLEDKETRNELNAKTKTLLECVENKLVTNDSFKKTLKENHDNFYVITDNIFKILNKDNKFESYICTLTDDFINYSADKTVSDFIDKDDFIEVTEKFIDKALSDNKTKELIHDLYSSIIEECISTKFKFIDKETKDFLLNIFIDSGINSLRDNLDNILKSVEFHKIAREEIEAMEPEKIHKMFNKFAGKYFRKLMFYGLGGFVFGINIYIGATIAMLKLLSDKLPNKKKLPKNKQS